MGLFGGSKHKAPHYNSDKTFAELEKGDFFFWTSLGEATIHFFTIDRISTKEPPEVKFFDALNYNFRMPYSALNTKLGTADACVFSTSYNAMKEYLSTNRDNDFIKSINLDADIADDECLISIAKDT